jgi:hypothetical protein
MELFSIRIQRTFQLVSTHNDLVFIVMAQYYGDITRPLVTQPLSNRQKKTENARMK